MSRTDARALIPDSQELAGRTALVTGGTTGIGKAIVLALVRRGVSVLTLGRDRSDLDALLEEARGVGGGEVHGVTADVSRVEEVQRVFREADRTLGELDILVNNAAVYGEEHDEQTLESIDYTVRTNVVGYLACAHEAVRRMRGRARGHVVLVGSMSADLREPQGSTYVTTKGAIQAFAESLRKTVNEQGIKVTLIEPGKVASDMIEKSAAEIEELIAKQEMLRPEDIAATVLFALMQPPRCDIVSLQVRPHRQVI